MRLSALLVSMAEADIVAAALTTGDVTVGSLFASSGAAVLRDGGIALVGDTPPEADVLDLAVWLRAQRGTDQRFDTNNLAASYLRWERHAAIARGLLAVFLSTDHAGMPCRRADA